MPADTNPLHGMTAAVPAALPAVVPAALPAALRSAVTAALAAALLLLAPAAGPVASALSAQEISADSLEALEDAAEAADEAGDRERARELYRRVLEHDPDDQRVLLRLGLLAGWEGDHEESLEYLDRVLELSPGRSDAIQARARVLAWSGRREAAIDTLRGVLRNRPDHVDTRETLARILGWEGRYGEAAEVLEPAVRMEPGDLELRQQLAEAYERTEQRERAEREYRELMSSLPEQAHLALGRLAMDEGDYVAAEEHFREAIEANPESVDARVALARVLRWQGRNRTALNELREARDMSEGAGSADWRWARSMVAPRVSVSYGAGHDNDGNDMASLRGSFSFPLGQRLQASAGVEWQDNVQEVELPGRTRVIAHETVTGELGLRYKSDLGWSVGVEAARMSFPDAGVGETTNFAASLGTPGRNPVALDLSAHSEMLDYTAVLVREQVRSVGGDLSARFRLGDGWDLSAGVGLSEFRGDQGDNRRRAGQVVLSAPRWGQFSMDLSARAYGFQHDVTDGYYDPNLYAKGEVVLRWDEELADPVEIGLEIDPGYRYSRSAPGEAGDWTATVGGEADVALVFAPGRRIQFRGSYSKSDPSTLGAGGTGDSGYEYWSLRGGLSWSF